MNHAIGIVPVILSSTRFVVRSLKMRFGNMKIRNKRMSVNVLKSTRLKTNIMVERTPRPENCFVSDLYERRVQSGSFEHFGRT